MSYALVFKKFQKKKKNIIVKKRSECNKKNMKGIERG